MDDFDSSNLGNKDLDEPIPFDDDTDSPSVSHSPLDLGSSGAVEVPETKMTAQPVSPVEKKAAEEIVSTDRITGVKTFFTKLHPGAIEFLDEQITNWLNNNPGITIKRTNAVTGMVQSKKTEPNIIITVWY